MKLEIAENNKFSWVVIANDETNLRRNEVSGLQTAMIRTEASPPKCKKKSISLRAICVDRGIVLFKVWLLTLSENAVSLLGTTKTNVVKNWKSISTRTYAFSYSYTWIHPNPHIHTHRPSHSHSPQRYASITTLRFYHVSVNS